MTEIVARSHFFAQLFGIFRTDAVFCPSEMPQHAITRGIAKLRGLNMVEGFVDGVKTSCFGNPLAFAVHGINGGVKQQSKVLLALCQIQQQ